MVKMSHSHIEISYKLSLWYKKFKRIFPIWMSLRIEFEHEAPFAIYHIKHMNVELEPHLILIRITVEFWLLLYRPVLKHSGSYYTCYWLSIYCLYLRIIDSIVFTLYFSFWFSCETCDHLGMFDNICRSCTCSLTNAQDSVPLFETYKSIYYLPSMICSIIQTQVSDGNNLT